MLIKKSGDLRYSEITPKSAYTRSAQISRRLSRRPSWRRELLSPPRGHAGTKLPNLAKSPFSTTEKENTYKDVTTYNNFYEFGTAKDQPAQLRQEFQDRPMDRLGGRRCAPSRASSAWTRS